MLQLSAQIHPFSILKSSVKFTFMRSKTRNGILTEKQEGNP